MLGSDGKKQGIQYNKNISILNLFHLPIYRLMMDKEHIQCEGQAIQCRIVDGMQIYAKDVKLNRKRN